MVSLRIESMDLRPAAVALLCACGVAASSLLLYRDFTQSAGEGLGAPMAKVERRESRVRRKPSRSFAWSNALQDENLFRRDSVQTGPGAAAAIRFNDGTLLEMGENSLVVIDEVQDLPLDFVRGSVILHGGEGDSRVTVGRDGKARVEQLAIRLLKPEPLSKFYVQPRESKAVRFAWSVRAGQESALAGSLSLQIAPDRSFRGSRLRSIPLKDPRDLGDSLSFDEGTYFWRLVAGDKPVTEIGQFDVARVTVPDPVAPVGGERLAVYGSDTPVQFSWSVRDDALGASQGAHEIQVARDPSFGALAASREIQPGSGTASIRGLPAGSYLWRIHSRYGSLQAFSGSERFEVVQTARPVLTPAFPEDKAVLQRAASLPLSWRSDTQGLDYLLEINGPSGQVIGPFRARATSHALSKPEAGEYRWRVTALLARSDQEEKVAVSDWKSFSLIDGPRVLPREPSAGKSIHYWENPPAFDFEWSGDTQLASRAGYSYQVVASLSADFKNPVYGPKLDGASTSMSSQKLSLGQGRYYWRVDLLDAQGRAIKSSVPQDFFYGLYPLLPAPIGVFPAPQAVVNLLSRANNPVARWQEVKDAERYEVELYTWVANPSRAPASTGGKPPALVPRLVSRTETGKTQLELKGLKPAYYYWTVRGIDRIRRKGFPMASCPFSVTYGNVLRAPKVLSPEVQ